MCIHLSEIRSTETKQRGLLYCRFHVCKTTFCLFAKMLDTNCITVLTMATTSNVRNDKASFFVILVNILKMSSDVSHLSQL